ncbi:hypothetical protein CORC01_13162, partial [Colletotrichum orchidophilum]
EQQQLTDDHDRPSFVVIPRQLLKVGTALVAKISSSYAGPFRYFRVPKVTQYGVHRATGDQSRNNSATTTTTTPVPASQRFHDVLVFHARPTGSQRLWMITIEIGTPETQLRASRSQRLGLGTRP